MSAGPVGHEMCEVDQLMGVTVSSGDSNGLRKSVWDRWQECARRLTTPLIKKLNIQVLPTGANFKYVAGPTLNGGANLLAPRRIRRRRVLFLLAFEVWKGMWLSVRAPSELQDATHTEGKDQTSST